MHQNTLLNDVLIVMARSLLQYAAQAWPWTGSDSAGTLAALRGLIAEQSARIQRIASLLDGRRATIDFGAFPDFTDLHYLSIEFVLPHLVANQQVVVREIEQALPRCLGDDEGTALLREVLDGERQTLARLEALAHGKPQPAQSAA